MAYATVLTNWSGAGIGAGVTVSHVRTSASMTVGEAQAATNAIRTWWDARKAALPDDCQQVMNAEVEVFQDDGTLVSVLPVSPGAAISGGFAGNWQRGAGRVIRLNTGQILNGRRLIGHMFVCPSGGVQETDGTIFNATIAADATAFATMLTSLTSNNTPLVVVSRAAQLRGDLVTSGTVTAGVTLKRPSNLRSRND